MIDCRAVADQLLRFRDGELPEDETEDLRKHLHLCPPCLHLLNTYEEVVSVLDRLKPCAMPPGLLDRLRAKMCGDEPEKACDGPESE